MRSIFVVGVLILLVSVVSAQYYNVAKINAGTGISVSPASGTGIVTVTATGAAIGDSAIAAWRAWRLYGGATRAIEFHGKYLVNALGGKHTWNIGKPDSAVDTIWTSAVIGASGYFSDAVYGDTLRMFSDPSVALIFLRGRGDSAWAIKARKGTTTWQVLFCVDTTGISRSLGATIAGLSGTSYLQGARAVGVGTGFYVYDGSANNTTIISGAYDTTGVSPGVIFEKLANNMMRFRPPTGKGLVGEADTLKAKKVMADSISLLKIAKHAFGNAAANLTDTILVAGATATSVIVGGDYIPDGASITYNALRKRVVVDTVFIYRVAITDPDSIGSITLIK